jgi:hypothetical protein
MTDITARQAGREHRGGRRRSLPRVIPRSAHVDVVGSRPFARPALLVMAGCLALAVLLADGVVGRDSALVLALVVVLVVVPPAAAMVASYRRVDRRARLVAISPLLPAALTWVALFVYRPIELYFASDHAVVGLSRLGFGVGDLTRTVALAAVGIAAWSIGYVVALGRRPRIETTLDQRPRPFNVPAALGLLAFGTLLWVILFERQGGVDTLLHSAVAIRSDQRSSFWAFVGVWIVQSVGLYALLVTIDGGTRASRLVLAAAAASTALAAVGTQLRMFAAFTFVSGIVLVLAIRRPRRRHVVIGIAVAALGAFALGFAQQVREYTHVVSTPDAIHLTAKTPLWSSYVSDLSTFDHFVAVQEVVPESVGYLGGSSIVEIPQAIVPRSLWPAKPLGFDHQVTELLYPGADAGIPISIQGELYWNGGIPVIVVGCLVFGLLCGRLVRVCLDFPRGRIALLAYALVIPFTHALLTRGLATMFQNLVFALTGLAIVVFILDGETRAQVFAVARSLLRRNDAAVPARR